MKIANVSLQNFCAMKYRNSKYNCPGVSKNILDNSGCDAFFNIEKFPQDSIPALFSSFCCEDLKVDIENKIGFINKASREDRPDSIELAKILELTKEQKISAIALFGFVNGVQLSKSVISDINKMCFAIENDIDFKDIFCRQFEDEQEADSISKVGDVFLIDGEEFVKIKTDNGIEQLFISRDTYLELFPPIERFGAVQSAAGDCYLLSVLSSIFQNPNKRDYILKMFKENSDGSIDCCFSGYCKDAFDNVRKKDDSAFELKNANEILAREMEEDCFNYAVQPEAFRLIELLWDKNFQYETFNSVKSKNEEFKKSLLRREKSNNGMEYSLQEKIDFLKLTNQTVKSGFNEGFLEFYPLKACEMNIKSVKDFIDVSQMYRKRHIAPDTNMSKLEYKYLVQILKRHLKYYEKYGETAKIEEILPKSCYEFLFGKAESYLKMPGATLLVADVLGLDSRKITLDNNLHFLEYFANYEYDSKKHILTCYIDNPKTRDEFEVEHHEYSCLIKEENGKKIVIVRNPYNMMFEKAYSLEEFTKTFKGIYVTEIPE